MEKTVAPTEIELNGESYRLGVIDARAQLHIIRRIAPFTSVMVASGGNINAMAHAVARMPQDDVDYILDTCLRSIKRKSGDGWANVVEPATGKLMFADIGGVEQYKLTQAAIRVFQDPFFAMLADVTN